MSNTKECKKTIQEALKVLGKKNVTMIVHGSSFPAANGENTGFGSPNSKGAKAFMESISGIFNNVQLGPAGKTKGIDSSPYTGTAFSDNTLFVDLFDLTTDQWANILSTQTVNSIVENNPNKDTNKTSYSYIYGKQEEALKEAYNNFKTKLAQKDKQAKKINKDFEKFIKKNEAWLKQDALYEALSVKHGNDYWPQWKDNLDKNLLNTSTKEEKAAAEARISEVQCEFAEVIDFYYFTQFVCYAQKQETLKFAKKNNIKMIADRQVAFSDRDIWANQSFFLPGWSLGCPPDYFSKDGQAWGFPVIDPAKLFNADGSLGEGGKALKSIFAKMFNENPGGVRIDHIIGLVDPWVYKNGSKPKPEEGAGRLFSSPEHPELAKYAIARMENINTEYDPDSEFRVKSLDKKQVELYGRLLEKIVIAAANEEGIKKEAIICEDLGTLTFPVEKVMEEYNLRGMRVTQFVVPERPSHPYRGKNVEPKQWIMLGTHDNEPALIWAEKLEKEDALEHATIVAEDLISDEYAENREGFAQEMVNNRTELAKAKFVELFTSPAENVQIFFSDFYGIKDVYNKPGTSGDKNWALRVPNNYEEFYIQQIKANMALNLAETLKRAIEVRGLAKKQAKLVEKLEKLSQEMKS